MIPFDPQSIKEIQELSMSPAGQQLIDMIQQKGGTDLSAAIAKAQKNDYKDLSEILSSLLQDPQTKKLINQLGR